jgi:hypothetical protein
MLKVVEQAVQLLTASSRCHSAGASGAAAFVRRAGESAASGDADDAMAGGARPEAEMREMERIEGD